jgi:hypothetical protein
MVEISERIRQAVGLGDKSADAESTADGADPDDEPISLD